MNKNILAINAKWNLGNMQVFSYGNSKLPAETLIVNLTSAHNCPSEKLGFCKCANVCYAKKCERIYKAYLNKNLTLEKLVQSWTIADWKDILRVYIQNAPKSIKYVRLNEAGDFPSQEMVDIFNELSNWLYGTFNIKTYCYTAREDLDFSNAYFAVNASSQNIKANRYFLCTDKQIFDNLPNYTIKCKGDCKKCSICYDSNYKGIIYCKQH